MTIPAGLLSASIRMGTSRGATVQRCCSRAGDGRLPREGEILKSSKRISESQLASACQADIAGSLKSRWAKKHSGRNVQRETFLALVVATLIAIPALAPAHSQALAPNQDFSAPARQDLLYVRPTQGTMAKDYAFDAYGPYPIAGAAFAAGINQWSNAPPEWGQGTQGFGKRFGSDYAIAAIGTRPVTGWRKPSGKIRCTTAAIAPA